MATRGRPWRLVWAVGTAALLASVSAGLLCAAEREAGGGGVGRDFLPPRTAPPEAPRAPEVSDTVGEVAIAAPESGAKLRGIALVEVEWPNPMGYIIFRIDDRFAYSTTPPYELRWDTSTAVDGQHIVSADAYDSEGNYAGTSSIAVAVENAIPTPPEGVLLTVDFGEHDMLSRSISARCELSALRSDERLPAGFEVLAAEFRGDLSQSVMDAFYEGGSTLLRSRLRRGSILVEGGARSVPETGTYTMVQVSRNGLALPASASRPRLGFAEISLTLRDFPVLPGDTWQAPVGVVCELYNRRAVFVQARHTFEGLRWYRGHECAVVTSRYEIPDLPLTTDEAAQAVGAPGVAPSYRLDLTQFRGPRGGMGGMRGGRFGGMRGRGGAGAMRRGPAGGGPAGRAGGAGPAARGGGDLQSARLFDLEGTRRTYLAWQTGRILHTEDTILGKVGFRVARQAAAELDSPYRVELTQFRGPRGGMGGMRGGRMGGMRGMGGPRGGMRGRAGRQAGAVGRAPSAAQRPGAGGAGLIPPRLDYGFRLSTDLVTD